MMFAPNFLIYMSENMNSNGWYVFDITNSDTYPTQEDLGTTKQVWGIDTSDNISLYGGEHLLDMIEKMDRSNVKYWKPTGLIFYP